MFDHVDEAPADPILGLNVAFQKDTSSKKVNLGVGAYRTDEGKPYVLDIVRRVEKDIVNSDKYDKEYLPIDGLSDFLKVVPTLSFGQDSVAIKENRLAVVQALSGTGALRIGAEFLKKYHPSSTVYVSDPTWSNHFGIFQSVGLVVKTYPYFDNKTKGVDLPAFLAALQEAPSGSTILLHLCAHNPTGADPTEDQWRQIADVIAAKGHLPFFDNAYQGYATGDLQRDAFALRLFTERGFELLSSQSFAKNLGLYGERVGAFYVVTRTTEIRDKVLSQLRIIIRCLYSNPPIHGARIVAQILSNPNHYADWQKELTIMSGRIIKMREQLLQSLKTRGTPGDWDFIVKQIGMFTFTGLTVPQVERMTKEFHIYLTKNGRISMAGLNPSNLDYVADAIHTVVVGK